MMEIYEIYLKLLALIGSLLLIFMILAVVADYIVAPIVRFFGGHHHRINRGCRDD